MTYELELKPRAIKDLKSLHVTQRRKVVSRIEDLKNDLAGDVQELLSDYQDLIELRTAKQEEGAEASVSLEIVKAELDS
jgi:mRNA-degrading endonuclease RelE of RelBE toxin-antitoxin system